MKKDPMATKSSIIHRSHDGFYGTREDRLCRPPGKPSAAVPGERYLCENRRPHKALEECRGEEP